MGLGKFVRGVTHAFVVSGLALFAACSGDEHLGPIPIQKSTVTITPSTIDLEALADLGEFRATRTDGQGRPSNLDRFLWRSLSPNVAQIDGAGRVVSLGAGTATIEVSVNGETATARVVVDQVPFTMSVGPRADTLSTIDQELDLKLDARDRNGFRIPRESFEWESDDPGVVSVTTAGRIRSHAEGRTRIRVKKRGRRDSTEVTVTRLPSAISIQPNLDTLKSIGGTLRLRAYQTDATGRIVEDDGFAWTSSQPSIASISISGQTAIIQAHASGVADIRAKKGTMEGFARIVVLPTIEQVSITPAVVSLSAPGQTVQLSASGADSGGGTVTASAFSWSSNRPSVATVNGTGRVTGVGHGTAQIVATAPSGAKGFATIGVGQISLNVAPKVDTLTNVGDQTSLAIYPTDAGGGQASCPSPTWKSLKPGVATVNSVGRVTAVGIGVAAIVVSACAAKDTATVAVTAPGGGGGGGGTAPPPSTVTAPELPRSLPKLPSGNWTNTINVPAGGNLQAAINSATAGTRILLAPGATYTGQFHLPNRGDNGWVQIETNLNAPSNVRVDSTLNFAKIVGDVGNGTVRIDLGADGWSLSLLEITSSLQKPNAPIYMNGLGADVADRVLVDRVYVHPKPGSNNHLRRCIMANASNVTVRYSVLADCHQPSTQTQGVVFWNTPGPVHIHDNLIMGASQGVHSGGAPGVFNHPSDVTIRRNHFLNPASWQGVYHSLAHIEFKDVRRVLIEGNVLDGGEFAMLFKSSGQMGQCGQGCGSTDITVRRNRISNSRNGVNLLRLSAGATVPLQNLLFEDNIFTDIGPDSRGWTGGVGKLFQVLTAPHNLIARNLTFNTAGDTYLYIVSSGPVTPLGSSIVFENIVANGPLRYRFLVQNPRGIANHYASYQMGTVYGDCANPPAGTGLTCVPSIPGGVGANASAVSSATSGVVR